MPLSREEIDNLLQLIGHTQDAEINCEQCLALVAEFAERHLAGKSLDEAMEVVEEDLRARSDHRGLRDLLLAASRIAGVSSGERKAKLSERRDIVVGKFASEHQADLDEEILKLLREE